MPEKVVMCVVYRLTIQDFGSSVCVCPVCNIKMNSDFRILLITICIL
jgi:hypothetical protein